MEHMSSRVILLVAFSLLATSCNLSSNTAIRSFPTDGAYDSEFPSQPSSPELQNIMQSVKRITCIAYYKVYAFRPEEKVAFRDITPELLERHEKSAVFTNNSTSGTGTVVFSSGRKLAILTCAHIIGFPDTVVTYHLDATRRLTDNLASIAFKKRQSNFVAVMQEGGDMDILAMDRDADLAVLGAKLSTLPPVPIPTFHYPLGRAKELGWGTFLYLFGFPSGYKMVTRGIVSSPNKDKYGSFLVDAVFSRGFSGGICLAIRDGIPNFELVGMVKLVSAHATYVVTPGKDYVSVEDETSVPYTGDLYIERKTEIEYGITQAISAERIREFLEENADLLANRGYSVKSLLESPVKGL
jgi:hypothetical protein